MVLARLFAVIASLGFSGGAAAVEPRVAPPALGLAVNLPPGTPPAVQTRALEEVRRTGVTLFALSLSWSEGEPAARQHRIEELTRTARLLRQSGAVLHLDLPLVSAAVRDVPKDLAGLAFDDPKLSVRLGRFFDALGPALLDFHSLSLGYEADSYFADRLEELNAYRRLFDGAVQFLRKEAPHLQVGVTTLSPTESRAPAVAAALHQRSPVLFYIYVPFLPGGSFQHRPPGSIERDWKQLLEVARGRPVAFPEVSFSSAPENGGSPEKQADFVKLLRRFLAKEDSRRLLFARYVAWRDPPSSDFPPGDALAETARRRRAFLANRGLQTPEGRGKPAWREWAKSVSE